MWENAYLSIKNPKASRAHLSGPWTPAANCSLRSHEEGRNILLECIIVCKIVFCVLRLLNTQNFGQTPSFKPIINTGVPAPVNINPLAQSYGKYIWDCSGKFTGFCPVMGNLQENLP